MLKWFSKSTRKIKDDFNNSMIYAEPIMIPLGIFLIVIYPLFYLINLYIVAPQEYNSMPFRIVMSLLWFTITLKNYWPQKMQAYLAVVWYSTLLITMPFFATFMTLKNHFSTAWAINSLAFLIWMNLLVDWIAYVILLFGGIIIGTIAYYCVTPKAFPITISTQPVIFADLIIAYIISFVLGFIFSHNKKSIEHEKLEAMKAVGASIAHELRTPLASINAGLGGIKLYLPRLIEGYELAKQHNLPVAAIREEHYDILSKLLTELEAEIHYSHTTIDMLLFRVNANPQKQNFITYSVKDCIEEAIQRYPFNSTEQINLVNCNLTNDFTFNGEKLFLVHIIFNLLKNALYYIAEAEKGSISIWIEHQKKSNILHFKDTAKGMSPTIYASIFKKFFTRTHNGTGLGLFFCKMAMDNFGGTMSCNTQEGEYTEFVLSFPK